MMNPIELTRNPEKLGRYRGEPYVVAADVSFAPGHVGQSGWTWYTGSAGWMYRVWVEEVLGLKVHGDGFTVEPSIPADWPGFEMTWRYRSATYEIAVSRRGSGAKTATEMDGERLDAGIVPLLDDGALHKVTVWLPGLAEPTVNEVQRNLVTAG